jgi:hypothetical protein
MMVLECSRGDEIALWGDRGFAYSSMAGSDAVLELIEWTGM